jgi:hypothetical protein
MPLKKKTLPSHVLFFRFFFSGKDTSIKAEFTSEKLTSIKGVIDFPSNKKKNK